MAEENGRTIVRHDEQLKHLNEKIDTLGSSVDAISDKLDGFILSAARRDERLDQHCALKFHDPAYVIGIMAAVVGIIGGIAKLFGVV